MEAPTPELEHPRTPLDKPRAERSANLKVEEPSKAEQASRREAWCEGVLSANVEPDFRVKRPARPRSGRWMTAAILDGDYRRKSTDGLLDLEATVEGLTRAESLMNAAIVRMADHL